MLYVKSLCKLFRNSIQFPKYVQYSVAASKMEVDGATVLAKALKNVGVEYMFGIVGVPVIEVAVAAQAAGIKYVGMRNEQAASYAASAIGYLTGKPAVCLTVSGPGLVHAFGGMANADHNCWPMIVVGGSSDRNQEAMGAFQEFPQVESSQLYCKEAVRPDSLQRLPWFVQKLYQVSISGRPGVVYLDMPGDMIRETVLEESILNGMMRTELPKSQADPKSVSEAVKLLCKAERPLVIIGKGAAYSKAEQEINDLINHCKFPFLPTPMGKGVVSDHSRLCVSAARTTALQNADVILLLGARLNWMLHFGAPPRFSPNVRIIQADIRAEELGSIMPVLPLLGDLRNIVCQLNEEVKKTNANSFHYPNRDSWWEKLNKSKKINQAMVESFLSEKSPPMNYYHALAEIRKYLPKDCIIVNEGANTMDIGRTMLLHDLPRHRLDAGTFGTMGVGLGFAAAAALYCRDYQPNKRVVCIIGDSAFGFSGMEIETLARYQLPILIIVLNNNGIFTGMDKTTYMAVREDSDPTLTTPPVALTPEARYDEMVKAFGGRGYFVNTKEELETALKASTERAELSLINLMIDPMAQRKPQDHDWLTKAKI